MKVNEPYQNAFFLWSDFTEITRYKDFLSFAFTHTTYLIVIPIIEIPNQEVVFINLQSLKNYHDRRSKEV